MEKIKLCRMLSKALWTRRKFYETNDFRFKEIANSYENAHYNPQWAISDYPLE